MLTIVPVSVVHRDLLGHLAWMGGMVSVVPLEPPEHLELMEETVTYVGPPGNNGRDGLPGASGRDGRDGAVGPPGPSAGLELKGIQDIVKLVALEESRTCTFPPVASCPGWSADRPATSCHSILDCNPSIPSGYYWITNGAPPHAMYCYMEADKCGVRGVMRVAHIDMRISSVNCPSPLTQYQLNSGERVCGSTTTARTSCDSVIFPTHNLSYQYVCGRAAGFSYRHPCAFWYYKHRGQNTTDHAYVSGLSITYGPQNGRNHIWTYVGGFQESESNDCNCPCAVNPGASSLPFVGQDFTVNLPLATVLQRLSGTPMTPSGTERTATLGAVAVTTLLLHGSGGHSRRIQQRT